MGLREGPGEWGVSLVLQELLGMKVPPSPHTVFP